VRARAGLEDRGEMVPVEGAFDNPQSHNFMLRTIYVSISRLFLTMSSCADASNSVAVCRLFGRGLSLR
jgi:hypothetical protein